MKKTNLETFNDEDYKPYQNSSKSKQRKKKTRNINMIETNSNKWTVLQNQRFLEFIKDNKELLLCPSRRKEEKVFLQLSNSVKTRSADQCRSHHQKMIKHHQDLEGVIRNLQQRLEYQTKDRGNMVKIEEIEQEKKNQDKINEDCYVPLVMQIDSESFKFDERPQENIWSMLDKEAWLEQQIFCPYD